MSWLKNMINLISEFHEPVYRTLEC